MSKNKKTSSKDLTELASKTLSASNSSQIAKKLAGSVLSQADERKQSGEEIESVAAAVLNSKKYSEKTKSLAGSVLSQSNRER